MASFNISSTCNGRSWSPSFSVALAYQVYYCYGSYSTLHSLKATDQPSPSDVPEAVLIRTFLTTQPSDGSCNYECTSCAYMDLRRLIKWTEVSTGSTQVIGLNLSLAFVASHLLKSQSSSALA